MTRQQFVQTLAPGVSYCQQKYGLLPAYLIAMAAWEAGWGVPADSTYYNIHNPWGVRATCGGYPVIQTSTGQWVEYPSWDAAARDIGLVLSPGCSPHLQEAWNVRGNGPAFIQELQALGWSGGSTTWAGGVLAQVSSVQAILAQPTQPTPVTGVTSPSSAGTFKTIVVPLLGVGLLSGAAVAAGLWGLSKN